MCKDAVLRQLPLWVLAGVLVVLFWRLWVGEALFWGLPALQFVPWRAYGLDSLRVGYLPLWNPYNGGGAPLFANYQSAFLYPLNWFGLLAPSYAALGWLMSVTAVFHLWLAGFGMWLLGGRLRLTLVGRGVLTLAYALTTYTVARLGTFPTVTVAAWIPFLLWSVHRIAGGGSRRDYGWLTLVTALVLLGGHAQTGFYGLLLAAFYLLWCVLRYNPAGWRRLFGVFAAVLLGVGIATPQLLATAELTLNSQRSSGYGEVDEVFRYSYNLPRAATLLAPNLFGNPGDGSYLGAGLIYEYGTYVGVITLVSAFVALFAWISGRGRRQNPNLSDVPFWWGVVVVAFVFSLGNNTPIYPFLYDNVPTFDTFQAPARWHIWTVISLAILGGIGAESWGVGSRVIFGTRLVTAGAFGGALLAVFSPHYLPADLLEVEGFMTVVGALGWTLLWVGLAGTLTLFLSGNLPARFGSPGRGYDTLWTLLVLVVLGVDLGWAGRGLNPTVPAAFYNPLPATSEITRGYWPPSELDLLTFGQRLDDEGELAIFEPGELGFNPLMYADDYRYPQVNWQEYRASNLPNLNLLDRTHLLNNNEPLQPAAYAVYLDGLPSTDEIATAGQLLGENDAAVDALHTATEMVALPLAGPRAALGADGDVVSVEDGYNRLTVTLVAVAEETTLTVADVAYPGWSAQINSEPAQMISAGNMARVVDGIPAGDSVVTFVYRPWWVFPGALVSLVSLILWLAVMGTTRQHPTQSE